jgi:hypothetical protein
MSETPLKNNPACEPVPAQHLNHFMMEIVMRNHVIMTLQDLVGKLLSVSFSKGQAPPEWAKIQKSATAISTASAQFGLDYFKLVGEQPGKMESALGKLSTQIQGDIQKLRGGERPTANFPDVNSMIATLEATDFTLMKNYNDLLANWNKCIAAAKKMISQIASNESKATKAYNDYKTAMGTLREALYQAHEQEMDFFGQPANIIKLFTSPLGTLFSYVGKFDSRITKVNNLKQAQQEMQSVEDDLDGWSEAEQGLTVVTAMLKDACDTAENLDRMGTAQPMLQYLEDDRNELLSSLRQVQPKGPEFLDMLQLTAAEQNLQQFQHDIKAIVSDINFNTAKTDFDMSATEVKEAVASGATQKMIDYWASQLK